MNGRGLDVLDRLHRLAEVTVRPGFVRAARETRPFSIAGRLIVANVAAAGVRPDVVLDVGANRGQFAAAALHAWPTSTVTSFEPLPAAAAALRSRHHPRLTVVEVACGSSGGEVDIFEHAYSPSSSILTTRHVPGSPVHRRVVVQRRLDELIQPESLGDVSVLLKLDVQGYELEVLAGAAGIIDMVDAVVIEQALVPDYEAQPLFDDSHGVLADLGFSLDRVVDVRRKNGAVIEMDSLYRRPAH